MLRILHFLFYLQIFFNLMFVSNNLYAEKKLNKTILFVWDGLRPDIITKENTPNLYNLKQTGVYFTDHHSSYPTVTMNNANSIATGNYAGSTGFYGNSAWRPDVKSKKIDFSQPVFMQQHQVLLDLDDPVSNKPLLYVKTLIELARQKGLKTAQVGKAGPVALQDAHKPTDDHVILSENKIYPLKLAKLLQTKGYKLPKNTINIYKPSELVLDPNNGDPTKKLATIKLDSFNLNNNKIKIENLSDPKQATKALYKAPNNYMLDIYLNEILEQYNPDLSLIWLREPDTTAHIYGPGSKAFYKALKNQDDILGRLLYKIKDLGLLNNINLIIVSDHGHSNVAGDLDLFPLRNINNSKVSRTDINGFSTSGNVRLAELLTKAGFKAFDGIGCTYNPILSGVLADGNIINKVNIDKTGSICGEGKNKLYTSKNYKVPKNLLDNKKYDDNLVIIANNGGSAFLYIPSENQKTVEKVIKYLQSRQEIGAIFVDSQYGDLPGTLPLKHVKFKDKKQNRHPDILLAMNHNEEQIVQGLPGTIYSNDELYRGYHGSLSRIDIHNVLIAAGPNFKTKYQDYLPTANVDVPVTIAHILDIPFKGRAGRVMYEALNNSTISANDYHVSYVNLQPSKPASNLKIYSLLDRDNNIIDNTKSNYTYVIYTKQLAYNSNIYNYVDSGKVVRY